MVANYLFCALAGVTWYFQFFFYTMGETQMGKYGFSSWTLHMASIIIFSTLWGLGLKEWKGAGAPAMRLLSLALLLLVGSTVIVGYGNYLALGSRRMCAGRPRPRNPSPTPRFPGPPQQPPSLCRDPPRRSHSFRNGLAPCSRSEREAGRLAVLVLQRRQFAAASVEPDRP